MKITHSIYRSWLTIALLCLADSLLAQGIQVTDFSFDEKDLTANIAGTEVIDPNNGRKCALIKVHTTQKGFTFDVGALGVTKTVPQGGDHPTEIWVYVPQGVKRLSIMHPQLGDLRDYDLGRTLQSAKTYHLTLQTGSVQTVVNPTLQKQWAVFTLVPATATIEVDGDFIENIPDRSRLRRVQTPQAFKIATIRQAYDNALKDPDFKVTDDCGVVRKYLPDTPIYVVEGAECNMKLTYKEDTELLETYLRLREQLT